MITIFTPAYNRAYILPKLYESLCRQSCFDFEWVIVDDGSSDGTEDLVSGFKLQVSGFTIRYFKQENGGKHRAINRGVKEAKGELFFIVDSDDQLTPDAVEWIISTWNNLKREEGSDGGNFAGLSGIRIYQDGSKIGGDKDFGTIDATSLDIRWKYSVKGDLAEIYRTDVLRRFPFPDINGEKFCTEALVWDRIASQGFLMRYVHKGIYIGGYLADGLSAKQHQIRKDNPEYSMLYDAEGARMEGASWMYRMKRAIKFWEFSFGSKKSLSDKIKMVGFPGVLFFPVGLLLRWLK